MAYTGYSNTDFARAAATTLTKHMRNVEEAMLRNFQIGALLDANGLVSYGNGGRGFDWPVQYRLHAAHGHTGENPRSFNRTNLWKQASLEYRGYEVTDAMFYKETRENRGEEAVVKVFDGLTTRLETSLKQALAKEYYIDGSAAGNSTNWHGLESMFSCNGTVNVTTGAQRAANAADLVGYPNDTYAGLSTALGNAGGENEDGQIWPNGTADAQYDFWSPLVVNYTSTSLGGTAHTFKGQGDEAMRYGIIHAQRNSSMDAQISNVSLSRNLYMDFLNLIDDKEQIQVNRNEPNSLTALGFKNVVIFDGMEVSWEGGVPTGVGYGYSIKNMELLCMDDDMFRVVGPEYDMDSDSFKCAVSTLSNLKFKSPRNFFKLAALA